MLACRLTTQAFKACQWGGSLGEYLRRYCKAGQKTLRPALVQLFAVACVLFDMTESHNPRGNETLSSQVRSILILLKRLLQELKVQVNLIRQSGVLVEKPKSDEAARAPVVDERAVVVQLIRNGTKMRGKPTFVPSEWVRTKTCSIDGHSRVSRATIDHGCASRKSCWPRAPHA